MSTPHNSAEKGQFAKCVLMPGDPLRAKFVAEHFLEDIKLVFDKEGIEIPYNQLTVHMKKACEEYENCNGNHTKIMTQTMEEKNS